MGIRVDLPFEQEVNAFVTDAFEHTRATMASPAKGVGPRGRRGLQNRSFVTTDFVLVFVKRQMTAPTHHSHPAEVAARERR